MKVIAINAIGSDQQGLVTILGADTLIVDVDAFDSGHRRADLRGQVVVATEAQPLIEQD
jgi:hypothetical protein